MKKFELFDGLVYRKDTQTSRFAVPEQAVQNIIRYYYDDMAHCCYEKTVQGFCPLVLLF